jgi:hypothetical protein
MPSLPKEAMMSESHFSPTRFAGWKRVALPGVAITLFGTPMLWALGVFDGTADPLQHAATFGVSGVLLSLVTPWCVGWALQGFMLRQKPEPETRDELSHSVPPRPGSPSHHVGRHS